MSNSAAATATATAAEGREGASIYSLDHHHGSPLLPPSEHLCHLHCTLCHTLLAVSVPCTSLYNTVTVTCGHCSTLLPVNLPALFLHQSLAAATTGPPSQPPPATGHNSFSPSSSRPLTGEAQNTCPRFQAIRTSNSSTFSPSGHGRINQFPKPSATNRPPEKRRRVPSAYNRFIKDEIQRIKAGNPNISHREAFSAAAKNWAHFPHIHFGLMPDHMLRKTSYHSSPGS